MRTSRKLPGPRGIANLMEGKGKKRKRLTSMDKQEGDSIWHIALFMNVVDGEGREALDLNIRSVLSAYCMYYSPQGHCLGILDSGPVST